MNKFKNVHSNYQNYRVQSTWVITVPAIYLLKI